jgi:glycolate oxidase FAD binding subunit
MGTNGVPTIGGAVAANASGPRRVQAGACRDSLIGVRFVDGRGTVVKNGGRVMKNVTGYDLVKLLAGSHGTLGVLSEVSFKVLPAVDKMATLMIAGLSDEAAIAVLTRALRSPFEVTGAAHTPKGEDGTPVTMLRLEGFSESVAYRTARLKDLLSDAGDVTVEHDPDKIRAGWARVRDVEAFAGSDGDIWRISVKPSDGPEAGRRAGGDVLYDWGGGLVWARVAPGTDLRAKLGDLPGHATLIRAGDDTRTRLPVFPPQPAPVAMLAAGLRSKFDPKGILNPGLMG